MPSHSALLLWKVIIINVCWVIRCASASAPWQHCAAFYFDWNTGGPQWLESLVDDDWQWPTANGIIRSSGHAWIAELETKNLEHLPWNSLEGLRGLDFILSNWCPSKVVAAFSRRVESQSSWLCDRFVFWNCNVPVPPVPARQLRAARHHLLLDVDVLALCFKEICLDVFSPTLFRRWRLVPVALCYSLI